MCVAPDQPPGEPLGVGIEQELVGIEAVAVLGLIRAVNAVAIELSGRNVIEVAVPDVLAALGKFDALELAPALAVEQAKLDFLRVGGEQRKVGAPAVPACTEAREGSGRQTHALAFRYEKNRSQRRDGQIEFRYQALVCLDFADIADVAAALIRGVRIQDLMPLAGQRHADTGVL